MKKNLTHVTSELQRTKAMLSYIHEFSARQYHNPRGQQYFSMQSEREIGPVAAFQILHETYEIVSWAFAHTKIPVLIKAQGQVNFCTWKESAHILVEWHISIDMKNIKCLYGLGHGLNSLRCCIICNQTHVKHVVLTEQVKSVMSYL